MMPAADTLLHVNGAFKVSGWAVDQVAKTAGSGLDLVFDGTPFEAIYGIDRGDVSEHFQQPGYRPSGFIGAIPGAGVSRGVHTLALRLVAADRHCYYQTSSRTVVVE
jgi:hypothetical protein